MKKHELLKYAYDNYPKGTKFKQMASGKTIESTGEFNLVVNTTYFYISDANNSNFVYSSSDIGQWAEIVTGREPLLTSEDGQPLYKGDKFFGCSKNSKGVWQLDYITEDHYFGDKHEFELDDIEPKSNDLSFKYYPYNDDNKLFSTKQAALDWIEKMNKPEKKYLKIERDLNNSGIKIGSEVIVTDGSYMIDAQTKEHVSGIYFNKDGLHEVLKVTKVNQPFETDYSVLSEILSVHNNCEITGFDNRKYYCSRINIKAI